MSSEPRRLAGRYLLDAPIGRGGMGEVWRGTDTVLGRSVAVKTIDLRSLRDDSMATRFEREARATAGLSHPNVVTVHDTGVEDDTAYIVMELLSGPSLADELAHGPLPVDEVVEVGRQVASALDAAHARGLVHRDVKPGNIVYAEDGRVRVLDFGIAQLTESPGSQALTATHTVMGTAEYLSPEQALGGRVDGRADLYALGCVLYALLAGRPPFRGATPVATMMMHANDPVPDVRTLRPDTPDWLAELVHSMLAKKADDRPAGAATVASALASGTSLVAAATAVLPPVGAATTRRLDAVPPAPVSTPPQRPVGPDRRDGSPWMWVVGVLAAAALALAVWLLLQSKDDGTPAATPSASETTPSKAPSSSRPPTTAAPTPTPSETPSPTPTTDPADAVASALSAFSDEVGALERDGVIGKDAAKKLDQGVREVEKALREGDPQKVSEQTDKLVQDYDAAVQDGSIPTEGADRLDPLLADLTGAVDAYAG